MNTESNYPENASDNEENKVMKISDIHLRDPFILPWNGKYYLYGSRGDECWGAATGLDVYISSDLENWTKREGVFKPEENYWSHIEYWAPEVHFINGRFNMTVSMRSEKRRRGTVILVSESPEGPFVPTGDGMPLTPPDWDCLDGTLYTDKLGRVHMVFCHEWIQVYDGEICDIVLDNTLTKAISAPRVLFRASEGKWVKKVEGEYTGYVTDGPFLYRTPSGKLKMLWSSMGTDGYAQAYAESDNGDIDGKWTISDELIMKDDGGHGMIFNAFDGNEYLVLHYPNTIGNERPKLYRITDKERTAIE